MKIVQANLIASSWGEDRRWHSRRRNSSAAEKKKWPEKLEAAKSNLCGITYAIFSSGSLRDTLRYNRFIHHKYSCVPWELFCWQLHYNASQIIITLDQSLLVAEDSSCVLLVFAHPQNPLIAHSSPSEMFWLLKSPSIYITEI